MDFRKRIFWRIVGLLGLLIALSSLVIGIYAVQVNRNEHRRIVGEQAFLIAQQASKLISWDDRVAIRELLDHALKATPYIRYAFVERDGKFYVVSPAAGVPKELLSQASELSHQQAERQFQDQAGRVFYDISAHVPGEKAAVHIGLDRGGVDSDALPSLMLLVAIAAGLFLLLLPVARQVGLAITGEMDSMTLLLRESNETLEARIVERTAEITRLNEALEQRIAERTAELQSHLDALKRLHELGILSVRETSLPEVLEKIVDAAVHITGADFGNIQLLDPADGDLKIMAQRGFPQWWLDFWNSVHIGKGVCGTALASGGRVIVEDVEQDKIFAGKPELEVQQRAGVRAVQSTPLVSRSGKTLGMFSTHYRTPHRFDHRTLSLVDLLARQAADLIEHVQTESALCQYREHLEELVKVRTEALRESEERFRILFDSSPDPVWIIDQQKFVDCNYAAVDMLGYPDKDSLRNVHPSELSPEFQPDGEPSYNKAERMMLIAKEQGINRFEWVHRRRDQSDFFAEVTLSSINLQGRQILYCIWRDITERKKLEERLRQAEKMDAIGRLAGGVAHDFNNMLQGILGYASMLIDALPPESPLRIDAEEIQACARRSADLTRHLLAFARKQVIAPVVLDLNLKIEGMLNMMRRLIGEDIELVWRPAAAPAAIKIDSGQIDQILVNLCVNARDAIDGVGKVEIEAGLVSFDREFCETNKDCIPGDYVTIYFSDNGCGMDRETLAHLYEPFFTTKGRGMGTGLGLATIHGIVTQNYGFILVDSEPGKGTTFKIHFPRHTEDAGSVAEEKAPAQAAAGGHETILLVEDEPSLVRVCRRTLEKLGYRVLAAVTPFEALNLAEKEGGAIDLVLTDVIMPGMNGLELSKRLISNNPGMKRLLMSGFTADVIAQHGVLDAGVHFIQKPFSSKELAEKVREALAD